jgi:hypothetical protein
MPARPAPRHSAGRPARFALVVRLRAAPRVGEQPGQVGRDVLAQALSGGRVVVGGQPARFTGAPFGTVIVVHMRSPIVARHLFAQVRDPR